MRRHKTYLLLLVAVVMGCILGLAAYMGYRSFSRPSSEIQAENEVVPNQELAPPLDDETDRTTAVGTVHSFMDAFMASAPPEPDRDASTEARIFVSFDTLQELQTEEGQYRLTELVGVQDIPDLGYQMGEVTYEKNEETGEEKGVARVPVTFNYSGGPVSKVFILSKSGAQWQITDVQE